MKNIKAQSLIDFKAIPLVQFSVFLSLSLVAPLLGHQLITGPIINAILFISVMTLGLRTGILLSFLPSLIALSTGILSLALAPIIPFIILGNILLVVSFHYLKNKNYLFGIISASFLKFAFLYISSSLLFNLFLKKELAGKIAVTMGWIQFLTAIIGGILAFFVLKFLSEKDKR